MARIHSTRRRSTLALRQRKAALLRQIAVHPDLMRASFVERYGECGKPNCRCHQGEKHGPFFYLTQCLAAGHIKKFLLKSPEQQQRARQGIDHFNELYDALEELSQINSELLRRNESLAAEAG
jgi:Family of unknown function (DUF6788)